MKTSRLTQPLKWHGGKFYMAKHIISLMPKHLHYCEPYAGGLAVLLARDPQEKCLWLTPKQGGVSEVVNDIDGQLMNFWRVLQSESDFSKLKRMVEVTPLSSESFRDCLNAKSFARSTGEISINIDKVGRAYTFFVVARQSRSGLMKTFTPLTRTRLRRGMNGNTSEWLGAVEGLADVHARLRGVVIECISALDLIKREDTRDTLFYLDPPYVEESVSSPESYRYRMTKEDHHALLLTIQSLKGKVMISGYNNELYDQWLSRFPWKRHEFNQPNQVSGSKVKDRRTECVWTNF